MIETGTDLPVCPSCGQEGTRVPVEIPNFGKLYLRCLACHLSWHWMHKDHVLRSLADRYVKADNARWRAHERAPADPRK